MSTIRRCIKDPFPGLSHWFGAALSVVALVALLVVAQGRTLHLVSFAVYGTCLILVYLASALAHSLHCSPKVGDRLDRFDYAAIFLMIAGTYTPLCLVLLNGPVGWALLITVWAIAIVGIVGVFYGRGLRHSIRVILYVVMGWLALAAAGELGRVLPASGIALLAGGGVIYSVGAIVFLTDKPHLWPGRFAAHDLWHVMVLLGSGCHFLLMLQFVA